MAKVELKKEDIEGILRDKKKLLELQTEASVALFSPEQVASLEKGACRCCAGFRMVFDPVAERNVKSDVEKIEAIDPITKRTIIKTRAWPSEFVGTVAPCRTCTHVRQAMIQSGSKIVRLPDMPKHTPSRSR